jgi:CDP-diacylglycerol--glycerol-3-phosphate 3-phosphatidyltransferase
VRKLQEESLKKLPNRITMFRIVAMAFFIPSVLRDTMMFSYASIIIFSIAAASDWIDGHIARKYNIISNFGKVMDPLADKIMILSALICFVQLHIVPSWMVIIIIGREFLVSGIRIMVAEEGEIIMASNWGKAKTVIEIIAVTTTLLLISINHTINYMGLSRQDMIVKGEPLTEFVLLTVIPYALMFLAAAVSLISGLEYFFKNKRVFDKEL